MDSVRNGFTNREGANQIALRLFNEYQKGTQEKLQGTYNEEAYNLFFKIFFPNDQDLSYFQRVHQKIQQNELQQEDLNDFCTHFLVDSQERVLKSGRIKRAGRGKEAPQRKLTSEAQKHLDVARRIFKKFDADQSGFLENKEIKELIKETYAEINIKDFQPNDNDVQQMLLLSDTNSDGLISIEEYEEFILQSLIKQGIKVEDDKLVL